MLGQKERDVNKVKMYGATETKYLGKRKECLDTKHHLGEKLNRNKNNVIEQRKGLGNVDFDRQCNRK